MKGYVLLLDPLSPLFKSQNLGVFSVAYAQLELKLHDLVPANKIQMKVTGESYRRETFPNKSAKTCWGKLFALHPFNLLFNSCLETGSDAWRHTSQLRTMSIRAIVKLLEQKAKEPGSRTSLLIISPAQDCPHLLHELC